MTDTPKKNKTKTEVANELSQSCINIAHDLVVISDLLEHVPKSFEATVKKKRKPRASDMPKLPKSAYLFYSMAHRAQAREQTGGGQAKDVMKLLARMWRSLDEKDKHPYYLRAMEEKKRYNREMRLYNANLATGNQNGWSVASSSTAPSSQAKADEPLSSDDGSDTTSSEDDDVTLCKRSDDDDVLSKDNETHISTGEGSDLEFYSSDASANKVIEPEETTKPKGYETSTSYDESDSDVNDSDTSANQVMPPKVHAKPKENKTSTPCNESNSDEGDSDSSAGQIIKLKMLPQKHTMPKDFINKKYPVKPTEHVKLIARRTPKPTEKGKQPMRKKSTTTMPTESASQPIMKKNATTMPTESASQPIMKNNTTTVPTESASQPIMKKNVPTDKPKRSTKGKEPMHPTTEKPKHLLKKLVVDHGLATMKKRTNSDLPDEQPLKKPKNTEILKN